MPGIEDFRSEIVQDRAQGPRTQHAAKEPIQIHGGIGC